MEKRSFVHKLQQDRKRNRYRHAEEPKALVVGELRASETYRKRGKHVREN